MRNPIKVLLILINVCFIGYIYFQPIDSDSTKRSKVHAATSEVKINPIEKRFPVIKDELMYILNKHKNASSCLIGSKTIKDKDIISIRGRYILKNKKGLFLLENIYEHSDTVRSSIYSYSQYYSYTKEVEIDNYDCLFPFNDIIDNLKNDSGISIFRNIPTYNCNYHLITINDNIFNDCFELTIDNLNFNVTYISIKSRTLIEMKTYYKDWVF